jgi:hypothetical protein
MKIAAGRSGYQTAPGADVHPSTVGKVFSGYIRMRVAV